MCPFLPMVQWDGMDSRDADIQVGTSLMCPFLPMVQWDGMDNV